MWRLRVGLGGPTCWERWSKGMVIPPAAGRRPSVSCQLVPQFSNLARARWPVQNLVDNCFEMVKGVNRRERRGEGVVADAPRGGQDESMLDGIERNAALEEPPRQPAISPPDMAEDARRPRVQKQNLANVLSASRVGRLHDALATLLDSRVS